VTPLLAAAQKRRDKAQSDLDALLAVPASEDRKALTEDEERTFEKLTSEIDKTDGLIKKYRKAEKRDEKAAAASAPEPDKRDVGHAHIGAEPSVYDPDNKRGGSYFQDLGTIAASAARLGAGDARGALERMERNAREFDVEMRKVDKETRRQFDGFIEASGGSTETRANPTTTFGQGGEFVRLIAA
jgi:hypothetical protein